MSIQLDLPFTADLTAEQLRLAASIRAPQTLRGYASDWKFFTAWCTAEARTPLPATRETVCGYVTAILSLGRRVSTAERHVSGIGHAHREAGFPSPCDMEVRRLLVGAQRLRCEQPEQKRPLSVAQLRTISGKLGTGARDARDRAILVFGFATALRRSSLAHLNLADLTFETRGIVVFIRHEKQDRAGRGREIGVTPGQCPCTCPVLAIKAWLEFRGQKAGALFTEVRNGRAGEDGILGSRISQIVKAGAGSIGLDTKSIAGHSLRSGFVTEAVERGVNEFVIASQTGHRSLATLRKYYRRVELFRCNASAMIGL